MSKNARKYNTLEVIDDLIKYAFVQHQNSSVMVTEQVEKKLKKNTQEYTRQALKEIALQIPDSKAPFILIIPRQLATVKYLEVPSTDYHEISRIIGFQAVKQVPFSLEEIVFDFQIIQVLPSGYSKIMLVIVHQDIINNQLNTLARAHIYPDYIHLNTQALSRVFEKESSESKQEESLAIIDIDYKTVNFLVIAEKTFRYSRSIPWEKIDIEKLGLEVELSIKDCRQQSILPSKIILAGNEIELCQRVSRDLEKRQGMAVEIARIGESWRGQESSFLAMIGATLDRHKKMNFLPVKLRKLKTKRKLVKETLSYSFLLVVILLISSFLFLGKVMVKKKYLDYLNQTLQTIEPKAGKIEEMGKKVEIIEQELSIKISPLDVLKAVYSIFPEQVFLSSFSFEKDKSLILKGISNKMSAVFDLIPKLEKSKYFENVVSKYATKRKIKGKELIEFQLQCSIEKSNE